MLDSGTQTTEKDKKMKISTYIIEAIMLGCDEHAFKLHKNITIQVNDCL
jgi:hypothetical protein